MLASIESTVSIDKHHRVPPSQCCRLHWWLAWVSASKVRCPTPSNAIQCKQHAGCQRLDNTGMFGNDLVNGCSEPVPNACACADRCAANPLCHGWTYIKQRNRWCPGGCFLKSQPLPALRPDRAMISGRRPITPATTQQRQLSTAMSATGCTAEDGMDRFGDDLLSNGCTNVYGTADACCAACQARPGCLAWAWVKPTATVCARGACVFTTTTGGVDTGLLKCLTG